MTKQHTEELSNAAQYAGGQAAGIVGHHAMGAAKDVGLVAEAIAGSHAKQAASAACRAEFLKTRAGEIAASTSEAAVAGVRSGAREQVKGHFIEAMTIDNYNAAGRLAGKRLVTPKSPRHRAYDAMRLITTNGEERFAGAVQIKTSASGVEKAISQVEKVKTGSASRATVIVSEDEVAKATAKAGGRIRVAGNGVSRDQASARLDKGVNDLATKGVKATSQARAVGKAGAVGAAVSVVVGGASEARALHRGDISKHHFAENRGVDAAEGAVTAAAGAVSATGAAAGATALMTTAAGTSAAASLGAAGTTALGAVATLGGPGAAAAGALGVVTAPVAIPAIAGFAAASLVGVGVAKVGKRVRAGIKNSRESQDS